MCRQRLLSATQSIDWWRHFVSEIRCIRVILFVKRNSVTTCVVRRLHQNFCLGRRRKFPQGFSSDLQRDCSMSPRRKCVTSAETKYSHRGDTASSSYAFALIYGSDFPLLALWFSFSNHVCGLLYRSPHLCQYVANFMMACLLGIAQAMLGSALALFLPLPTHL